MTPIQGMTGIAALEAEMRDRLAAKDAEIARLRASHTELREIWLRDGWRLIETAPRDGTVVDLWGNNRDPDKRGGILLPMAASEGRYTDCAWTSRMVLKGSLFVETERTWYQVGGPVDGDRLMRIWPTHWRPVPGRPT